MHTDINIHIHTYRHIYTHTHMHTHKIHVPIHTYVHKHIYIFSHTGIYTQPCTHIQTQTHIRTYKADTQHMFRQTHIYMCTHREKHTHREAHTHILIVVFLDIVFRLCGKYMLKYFCLFVLTNTFPHIGFIIYLQSISLKCYPHVTWFAMYGVFHSCSLDANPSGKFSSSQLKQHFSSWYCQFWGVPYQKSHHSTPESDCFSGFCPGLQSPWVYGTYSFGIPRTENFSRKQYSTMFIKRLFYTQQYMFTLSQCLGTSYVSQCC